jgi:protein-L-isoaspartate(D-aspartate) O-methyltransferase
MDYQAVRHNMVENQIRPNRVTNAAVIDAMEEIPREKFVPEESAGIAYVDEAAAIGDGRYLMEPSLLARILQEANVSKDDLVLNIGCGTGYSAAVLAKISKAVVAVEENSGFAEKASALMVELGIDNAVIIEDSLADGYAKQAPYDVIVISGAVEEVPQMLLDQLVEGGRLVSVLTGGPIGKVVVTQKIGESISNIEAFDAGTPLLPGFRKEKAFEL